MMPVIKITVGIRRQKTADWVCQDPVNMSGRTCRYMRAAHDVAGSEAGVPHHNIRLF